MFGLNIFGKRNVHDFRTQNRRWGHDYTWSPLPCSGGIQGTAIGWGLGIKKGDIIVFTGPNKGASPYKVDSISYYSDPTDMFKAQLSYHKDCEKDQEYMNWFKEHSV